MKKMFTSPWTYVVIAIVAIVVYLVAKDGGIKISTGMATTPATTTPTATA